MLTSLHLRYALILHLAHDSIGTDAVRQCHDGSFPQHHKLLYDHGMTGTPSWHADSIQVSVRSFQVSVVVSRGVQALHPAHAPPTVMACLVVFLRARCTSPLPAQRCVMPTSTRCSHDCISDELNPIHTVILHAAHAPPTVMACLVVFLRARCTSPLPAQRCSMPTTTRCSHDCISDELHPIHTVILHLAHDSIGTDAVRQCHYGSFPQHHQLLYDHGMAGTQIGAVSRGVQALHLF